MRSNRGSAVEFALVVPLLSLLALAYLRVSLLAFQQFRLERLSGTLARTLALAGDDASIDLQMVANSYLQSRSLPIAAKVDVQLAPVSAGAFPRDTHPLQIIDLSLTQTVRPIFPFSNVEFNLIAHGREVRQ